MLESLFPRGASSFADYLDYLFVGHLADIDNVSLGREAAERLWPRRNACHVEYFDA